MRVYEENLIPVHMRLTNDHHDMSMCSPKGLSQRRLLVLAGVLPTVGVGAMVQAALNRSDPAEVKPIELRRAQNGGQRKRPKSVQNSNASRNQSSNSSSNQSSNSS